MVLEMLHVNAQIAHVAMQRSSAIASAFSNALAIALLVANGLVGYTWWGIPTKRVASTVGYALFAALSFVWLPLRVLHAYIGVLDWHRPMSTPPCADTVLFGAADRRARPELRHALTISPLTCATTILGHLGLVVWVHIVKLSVQA